MAELSIKDLQAEIQQLNRLVPLSPLYYGATHITVEHVSPSKSCLLRLVKERKTRGAQK